MLQLLQHLAAACLGGECQRSQFPLMQCGRRVSSKRSFKKRCASG